MLAAAACAARVRRPTGASSLAGVAGRVPGRAVRDRRRSPQGIGNPSVPSGDDRRGRGRAGRRRSPRRSSTRAGAGGRPPGQPRGPAAVRPRSTRRSPTRRCPTCCSRAGCAARPRSAGSRSPTARSRTSCSRSSSSSSAARRGSRSSSSRPHFTPSEARDQIELKLITTQIQKQVLPEDPERLGLRDPGLLRRQQGAVRSSRRRATCA